MPANIQQTLQFAQRGADLAIVVGFQSRAIKLLFFRLNAARILFAAIGFVEQFPRTRIGLTDLEYFVQRLPGFREVVPLQVTPRQIDPALDRKSVV